MNNNNSNSISTSISTSSSTSNNNSNNNNQPHNQSVTLQLPWNISIDQYNRFVFTNHLQEDNYKENSVVIPTATQIDFSPLFPKNTCLPFQIIHNNPLHRIEKLNRETHLIECKGTDNLWVRDMATTPGSQNIALGAQLQVWNLQNNLGVVCSEQTEFRLLQIGAQYRPDVSFKTLATLNLDNWDILHNHITTHPPNFIIEVRSYNPYSQNNQLGFQQDKMVDWMTAGVESGILYDGPGGYIHVYCRTNFLNQQIIVNQIANQQAVQAAPLVPPIPPPNFPNVPINQSILFSQQLNQFLFLQQTQPFNHIYFNNMNPVLGHPDVLFKKVPLWSNPIPPNPINGPNIIVHCIGSTNGLKLNLSTVPM